MNVFKDDIKAKGNAADLNVWPGEGQDIGLKIKNYIKDMNKLIDEEVKASGEDDQEESDEENMAEVPDVPETDEN